MCTPGKRSLLTVSMGLASIGLASQCWGAGPWLAETGGADMGMAGAGRAAMSLDATSLAANPAAMAGLARTTVTTAVMPLELDYEFRGSDDTPAEAANREGVSVVPALFAVHQADRLTYGIGVFSYFGVSFVESSRRPGSRPSTLPQASRGRRRID
jgi:long-subunit fatty acid transport protein